MSPEKKDNNFGVVVSNVSAKSKKQQTGSNTTTTSVKNRTTSILTKKQEKESIKDSLDIQEKIFQNSSFSTYYEDYSVFQARVEEAKSAGKNWTGKGPITIHPAILKSRFWQLQKSFCDKKNWRVPKIKNMEILNGPALSWLLINPTKIPDSLYWRVLGKSSNEPIPLEEKAKKVQDVKTFLKHGEIFPWEKLMDPKTKRQYSNEKRMYWWKSPINTHIIPTIANTSFCILELPSDGKKPRFFLDAYAAKREIEHIIEGNKEAIEDMEILLSKVKAIRIQIESIETFDLKARLERIRKTALAIINPTITTLDMFTCDTRVTREAYITWKKTQKLLIGGDEQLLSDIERYAIDKQSRDKLIEKGCDSSYESFTMTTGLRTKLGKGMRKNLFRIQNLKDSKGNWNPGAFLASTIAAINKIEKRKIELTRQIRAMEEHGMILERYLQKHEAHFHAKYNERGEEVPLPFE